MALNLASEEARLMRHVLHHGFSASQFLSLRKPKRLLYSLDDSAFVFSLSTKSRIDGALPSWSLSTPPWSFLDTSVISRRDASVISLDASVISPRRLRDLSSWSLLDASVISPRALSSTHLWSLRLRLRDLSSSSLLEDYISSTESVDEASSCLSLS